MNEVCWQASGSITVLLALVTTTVAAQTADERSVAEVVVTARRRAESIQNVPESITALDRSQMEQCQIHAGEGGIVALEPLAIEADCLPAASPRRA